MSYKKRLDGRGFNEIRPMTAKVGVIKNAVGSAFFKIGHTSAYAAVYGPRELHPRFLQNPERGVLRCHYNMMPFAGPGERGRPGPNRRAKEISFVTEKALEPVMDLSDFPNTVVDVFIELPETDAGSRCAGIVAASMALADAGFAMKDLPCSIAAGRVADKIVIDLNGDEEHYEDEDNLGVADLALTILPNTGIVTHMQMDGKISEEQLAEAIENAKEAIKQIYEVQKNALKEKYTGEPQ